MEPNEVDIVVCVPVRDDFTPAEGSMKWDGDCGHQVWVSRSTQHFLVHNPQHYRVKCLECAARDHGATP